MRKLKLQMQVTVDGYVAGPEGQLDWMTFDMDAGLLAFINHLTDTSDTILLGRKMTGGFIKYWEHVVTQEDSPEHEFALKMVGLPKVVFSKTVQHVDGKNVRVENGDLVGAVKDLKSRPGKDMIVYGGATFVSSLIENGLIDEMNLFVNPVAIGSGMRVFKGKTPLGLAASTAYPSGIVVNSYLLPVPSSAHRWAPAAHVHETIDYIEITVTDVPEAKRFYGAAFGWVFNDYGPDYAGIQGRGREVGGLRRDAHVRAGGPLVVLYSRTLDDTMTKVEKAGGRIVKEPSSFPGGRRFHFSDPSGNELAVWSET